MISDERILELRNVIEDLIREEKKDLKGFLLLQKALTSNSGSNIGITRVLTLGLSLDHGREQIIRLISMGIALMNRFVEGSDEFEGIVEEINGGLRR